ncbi:MAG TPA: CsgG/HfaB family protein [Pseudolabrys sp.]|jgi:curli production assembly/transport component CsgG|nr:CsgG/HfaB family protein [Pseudolabrys sp.]
MRRICVSAVSVGILALALGGCETISGTIKDPMADAARLVPATKSGVALEALPPPVRPLDVSVYNFPDLTGQNKPNDNFAEFSRALTQGASAILIDVLTKAGGGKWFNVVERQELQPLLTERQIIQNTRNAILGSKAPGLPPLRFAGVILDGGIIGYDSNETTGGIGANLLGVGADTQYRQDVVTVALRAVSVQTGRVLASVTTTKTIYSVLVHGSAFMFVSVNHLLQAETGFTRNSPATLAVREGIQMAVYALIFEGVKKHLWEFKDKVAGAAFMRALEERRRAIIMDPDGVFRSVQDERPAQATAIADSAQQQPATTQQASTSASAPSADVASAKDAPLPPPPVPGKSSVQSQKKVQQQASHPAPSPQSGAHAQANGHLHVASVKPVQKATIAPGRETERSGIASEPKAATLAASHLSGNLGSLY